MKLRLRAGISGAALPRSCQRAQVDMHQSTTTEATRCPIDPYLIMPDRCSFIDQQTVKLQEAPEQVPVGELPRNMLATLDRYLANSTRSVPGTRVTIVGVYSIFQGRASRGSSGGGAAVRSAYIRAIGIEVDGDSSGRAPKRSFTEAEEAAMLRLARQPDIYEKFARSVAPSIYGYDDIKRAATCLLFGGSRKQLADGMRLRGDVNVLLLGDPGTAKSQLLKFIERVAPIGVYTSGKGSSAAGLTASVVRDAASREFYLEGGAMVLADGGVVCIDEFDKMREEDRVAIHEAMEQQTISIAKAGITTVLNSRTSVMAAANPVFGRYDDMKSPGENVDFQSTILSRFDLIFIVKDEHSHDKDMSLARHVIRVHSGGSSASLSASEQAAGELDMSTMKTFISYVRSRCAPRLSPEAADKLANHFVSIRSAVRAHEADSHTRSTIPITIRQLEAIIRISESLAKIRLAPFAGPEHVEEALRLFQVSTLSAVQSGQMIDGVMRDNVLEEVERVEREIRRRVPVGSRIPSQLLSNDLIGRRNFSKTAVEKALQVMLRRQELRHINQRRVVERMF
ncbi:hypothetical protein, variant [Fonticula alba]|nr:hypothetical protein, variant [Fonticula alba]KCV69738.1 hypothetical protein, variant [Fonticula alba]|eukprot:XP_009496303.1 hypothetical protein, variant [Fonticula alba]